MGGVDPLVGLLDPLEGWIDSIAVVAAICSLASLLSRICSASDIRGAWPGSSWGAGEGVLADLSCLPALIWSRNDMGCDGAGVDAGMTIVMGLTLEAGAGAGVTLVTGFKLARWACSAATIVAVGAIAASVTGLGSGVGAGGVEFSEVR